jgi:hypothetical protein
MSTVEDKYRKNIGKLFIMNGRRFISATGEFVTTEILVMPVDVKKISGWWHYQVEYLNHPEVMRHNQNVSSKLFDKQAIPVSAASYHNQPPMSSEEAMKKRRRRASPV